MSMSDLSQIQRKGRGIGHSPVRCPYCVEDSQFKVMQIRGDGDGWHMCQNCGHLAMPNHPEFRCTCVKCSVLETETSFRSR